MAHLERVVVLVDMDCFYCQVEEKLNPSLAGKPIAVVQYNAWKGGGIIAVNYPARDRGVTRHMRGDEAREKCPDIKLVRVPNIREKADISKYREAGKRVAEVLQTFTPLLERASVDEAYLDITEQVNKRIAAIHSNLTLDELKNTHVVGCSVFDFLMGIYSSGDSEEHNLRLAMGGAITEEIRAAVLEKTGYKCSAGVAHNKIIAKLGAGLHKPNQQTILPQDGIASLFESLPLRKIRSLGGKFGEKLSQDLNIQFMGELSKFTEKELAKRYDDKTVHFLYNIARGIDNEPVSIKLISKSIGCCKKFAGRAALCDIESVTHWVKELSDEIRDRLEQDIEENNRKAKHIIISFTQEVVRKDVTSSRTVPLYSYETDKIQKTFTEVINKYCLRPDNSYKIKYLGLSVGKFEENKKIGDITSFFKSNNQSNVETQNGSNANTNNTSVNKENVNKNQIMKNKNTKRHSDVISNFLKSSTVTTVKDSNSNTNLNNTESLQVKTTIDSSNIIDDIDEIGINNPNCTDTNLVCNEYNTKSVAATFTNRNKFKESLTDSSLVTKSNVNNSTIVTNASISNFTDDLSVDDSCFLSLNFDSVKTNNDGDDYESDDSQKTVVMPVKYFEQFSYRNYKDEYDVTTGEKLAKDNECNDKQEYIGNNHELPKKSSFLVNYLKNANMAKNDRNNKLAQSSPKVDKKKEQKSFFASYFKNTANNEKNTQKETTTNDNSIIGNICEQVNESNRTIINEHNKNTNEASFFLKYFAEKNQVVDVEISSMKDDNLSLMKEYDKQGQETSLNISNLDFSKNDISNIELEDDDSISNEVATINEADNKIDNNQEQPKSFFMNYFKNLQEEQESNKNRDFNTSKSLLELSDSEDEQLNSSNIDKNSKSSVTKSNTLNFDENSTNFDDDALEKIIEINNESNDKNVENDIELNVESPESILLDLYESATQKNTSLNTNSCKDDIEINRFLETNQKSSNNNVINHNASQDESFSSMSFNDKQKCDECNKMIKIEEFQSHKDYHFAISIVREESSIYKNQHEQQKIENTKQKSPSKTNQTKTKKRKLSNDSNAASKSKKLTSFFNKPDNKETSNEPSEVCLECGKPIPISEISVHLDYHTAKKLQMEINGVTNTNNVAGTSKIISSSNKNNNTEAGNKSSSNKKNPAGKSGSVLSFFKPK